MGCVETIRADRWPKQGALLGKRVKVCFHYDTTRTTPGRVIRDDNEAPFVCIIALEDDGRVVLATECQFSEYMAPSSVGRAR